MLTKVLSFFGLRRNWSIPYVLFLLFFVLVPLALIVFYAFTSEEGGFSFINFRKFMMHPEALKILIYSIGVAMITTIICLLIGYPAAYILSRMEARRARFAGDALYSSHVD